MKTFALFILLAIPVVAQEDIIRDTLNCLNSTTSTFYGVDLKASEYNQVWVTVLELDTLQADVVADTFKIQQRVMFRNIGGKPKQDSVWITLKVYNPFVSETPDTLVYVRELADASSAVRYTQFMIWSPFIGDRWRMIHTYNKPNIMYYKICNKTFK
jgi:hypothetical protein